MIPRRLSEAEKRLLTQLGGSSVLQDGLLGGVEAEAEAHVAHLEGVHIAVTAVPEIEQLEHLPDFCEVQ